MIEMTMQCNVDVQSNLQPKWCFVSVANERVLNEVAAVNDAVYVNQANLPMYISRLQNKHNQAHTAVSLCVVYIRSDFLLLILYCTTMTGLDR